MRDSLSGTRKRGPPNWPIAVPGWPISRDFSAPSTHDV
jgi:hypothetical protein